MTLSLSKQNSIPKKCSDDPPWSTPLFWNSGQSEWESIMITDQNHSWSRIHHQPPLFRKRFGRVGVDQLGSFWYAHRWGFKKTEPDRLSKRGIARTTADWSAAMRWGSSKSQKSPFLLSWGFRPVITVGSPIRFVSISDRWIFRNVSESDNKMCCRLRKSAIRALRKSWSRMPKSWSRLICALNALFLR